MISHITQVASNRILVVFTIGLLLLSACASTPKPPALPELSQVQVRQLQTREYDNVEETLVIKAVVAALQDEGYIISTADPDIGLVTAAMEVVDLDTSTKAVAEFWNGSGGGTYQTTRRFEVSATVQKNNTHVRVRINIVAKALTNSGGIVWSQPVYEAKVYQDIFSKVDKSVFLQKENI